MPQSRTVPLLALLTLPVLGSCESEFSHTGDGDEVAIFQVAKTVVMPTGDKPVAVAIGQFDGNAGMDLAVANRGHDTVQLYLNNADGTFTLAPSIGTNGSPLSVRAVGQFMKLQGETKETDLVVSSADNNGKAQSYYSNRSVSKSGFTLQGTATFDSYDAPRLIAGELDEDKWDDALFISKAGAAPKVYIRYNVVKINGTNYGGGGYKTLEEVSLQYEPVDLAIENVNGDTNTEPEGPLRDLVVLGTGTDASGDPIHVITVRLRDAGGTYTTVSPIVSEIEDAQSPHSIALEDVNKDTHLDAIVSDKGAGMVHVLLGDGTGAFTDQKSYTTESGSSAMDIADLNADSHPDIVVANSDADSISVLMGSVGGDFVVLTPMSVGDAPSAIAIGQLGGVAARPDIAVTCEGSDSLILLLN